MVETEHADFAAVVPTHAEDEINDGRLARTIRADEPVNRAAWHGQVERSEFEGGIIFGESANFI